MVSGIVIVPVKDGASSPVTVAVKSSFKAYLMPSMTVSAQILAVIPIANMNDSSVRFIIIYFL